MIELIRRLFNKKETGVKIPKKSKKDEDWAIGMNEAEDYYAGLDSMDVGEAYNFHMDCGDR